MLFTIGIVFNQLAFATTSILNHTRLGGLMSRQTRSIAAYTLGLCSFLFGFCKILIIISLSTIASFGFQCPSASPSAIFVSEVCSDTTPYVDCELMGFSNQDNTCKILSCRGSCSYQIPMEVFILSATFGLTFIYSLFMCDMLLNRPDEVMSLIERQQQLNRDLMDPIKKHADTDLEPDEEQERRIAERKAAKRERRAAKYGAMVVASTAAASQIKDQLLFSEDLHDDEDEELDEEAAEELYQRRVRRARAMEKELARIPRTPASQHDMIELDPLSKKAFELAQSLSSQELLLCMMESDYRKHLTNQLRMRDIFYRLLRDFATLAKFALTMASSEFKRDDQLSLVSSAVVRWLTAAFCFFPSSLHHHLLLREHHLLR
jgi:hypothetical protein